MGDKKEYIERGTLIRLFDERYITAIVQQKHDDVSEDHKKHWKGVQSGTNWCRNTVLEAPATDVVEVRHGEWIRKDGFLVCSECDATKPYAVLNDTINYWRCDYCNRCGAKMDGERKGQSGV